MLSVNSSVDDIHNYPYPQRTSQMNPNLSSVNISQLNHPKAVKPHFLGQFSPLTPPSSNATTPVCEKSNAHFFAPISSQARSSPTSDADKLSKWLPVVDFEVVTLCTFWYAFSIVSANSTKAILSRFKYPVTLTQFQFLTNASLCILLFAALSHYPKLSSRFPQGAVPQMRTLDYSIIKFIKPTGYIISTTLPMGIFQFMGHITSHKATSVIPVSLVHTIKALSPITTVMIYRIVYKAKYLWVTYVTLIPLMLGIMLTCYKPRKASSANDHYFSGLAHAFISMFIFVSQNIFAKKRLTYKSDESREALPTYKGKPEQKLDKLTILLFCSVIGFVFTIPIYTILEFQNENFSLLQMNWSLFFLVVLNGTSHFMQSLLAFMLLGSISPINYSIANIMKRVAVILFAFVWESTFSFSGTQGYGVLLTIIGLYCYDKWGGVSKEKHSRS